MEEDRLSEWYFNRTSSIKKGGCGDPPVFLYPSNSLEKFLFEYRISSVIAKSFKLNLTFYELISYMNIKIELLAKKLSKSSNNSLMFRTIMCINYKKILLFHLWIIWKAKIYVLKYYKRLTKVNKIFLVRMHLEKTLTI